MNDLEKIDYVVCQVCNRKLQRINNDHLKLHNLSCEGYKRLYPGFLTICKSLSTSISNKAKEVHKDPNSGFNNPSSYCNSEKYKENMANSLLIAHKNVNSGYGTVEYKLNHHNGLIKAHQDIKSGWHTEKCKKSRSENAVK